jgi:O-antigen ligase
MMGALAGALFLRGGNSIVKGIALVLGGLVFNGMVLTRTRAAYVAVLIGAAVAFYLAGRSLRRQIAILMVVGLIGGLALTDHNFWERMDTMQAEQIDRSASTRLEFWQASLRMYSQHPLGVGAGNFFGQIGLYLPEHPGRDTHNTYLRCLAELGAAGVVALLALMANAFRVLHKCKTIAINDLNNHALYCDAWGLQVMLVIFLAAGCFMTMTYTEELFFLLSLPACLERAVVRAREELMPVFADESVDEYCDLESDELELMTCEQ